MEPIKDPMNENSEAEATENSETLEAPEADSATAEAEAASEVKSEPEAEPASEAEPPVKGKSKRPIIIAAAIAAVAVVAALIAIIFLGGHTHVAGDEVRENVVPATCTADGSYVRVIYCKDCSEEISRKEIKELALGHTGGTATCQALAECTRCEAEYGNLAPHDYEAATCTAAKTCKVCSATDGAALGHNFADSVVPATCTAPGYTLHSCTNSGCTESYQDTQVDAAGHSWVGEPTCAADRECANCDEKQPAINHSYEIADTISAGCLTEAKTVYECSGCGDEYSESVGSALGHNITGVVPTEEHVSGCTYVQKYACARCSETVEGDTVERHTLSASITTAATCSADGVKTTVCTKNCGYSKDEPIEKNATGHDWVIGEVENGKRTDTCSHCQTTKSVTVYTGNNTGSTNANDFADTEIELNDTNISMDSGVIDSIGNKDVTLSADKLEGDDRLDLGLDGEKLAQVGDSPIYNFTINDGSQNISSFGENNYVTITLPYTLAPGEDVDNIAIWFIADNGELESIPATYNNGYVTFKTNHFSYYTVTRLTPEERCALYGHSNTTRDVEATCLTDGYTLNLCVRCHHTEKTNVVVADGHNFGTDTVSASCTVSGKVVYLCSDCGYSYENKLPAIGHAWENVSSVEATCASAGSNTYSCSNCGESYVETLAQKKHELADTVVPADCENEGYTLHECENCDHSYKDSFTAAVGHSYTVSFEWSDDNASATALFVCKNNAAHILELDATVEVKTIDATCSGGTVYEYTAKVVYGGVTYTDMVSVSEGEPSHTYGSEWKFDDNSHWHECVCGAKSELADHSFGQGAVTKEATCIEAGVKTYTCECGKTKTESVPATGVHKYQNGVCTGCGAEGTECDHTVLHWDYIEMSDYGYCHGTLNYQTCDCGEVVKFCEDYSELSCDSDQYDLVVEETENGEHATATVKCENCDFRMDMEGWMVEDGCTQSITYNYTVYDKNGAPIITLVAEESYDEHEYKDTSYEVSCGGALALSECRECGEIIGLEGINVNCAGAPDFDLDLDIDDGEDQHFAYDFECADCGLVIHYAIDVTVDACKTVMYGSIYLAVGNEVLADVEEEYVYEDHDFDYTYELMGDTCKDGVKSFATCTECGFSVHMTDTYHAETEHDVELDVSEFSAHVNYINVNRCKVCGTVTYVSDFDYDCEPDGDFKPNEILGEDGEVIGMEGSFTCSCGLTFSQKMLEYNSDPCTRIESQEMYVYKNGNCIFSYVDSEEWTEHDYEYEFEMLGDSCEDGVKVHRECKNCGRVHDYETNGHETEYTEVRLTEYGLCGGYVNVNQCRACGEITYSYVSDYECSWNHQGTEGGYTVYSCNRCGTVKKVKTVTGEKGENCRFEVSYEYNYYRNGTLVYSSTYIENREEHNYEYTYELNGDSCEDGVRVYRTCRDCGYSYDDYYNYHTAQMTQRYDLAEYGACYGYVELYTCPCGEESWINWDMCAHEGSYNNYKGDDGYAHQVEVRTCRDCGLRYQREYYSVPDVANCKEKTYYSISISVGATAVGEFDYTDVSTLHSYQVTATLMGGAGSSCEDGVIITYTCKTCGYSYKNEIDWHETYETNRIDISALGSACGGYFVEYSCACGENRRLEYNDYAYCEFDQQWQNCWVENAILGWIGNEYYGYSFYDYVCSVTSPACGFTVRYGRYYVAESGCRAVEYCVYLFGYDEATGTYEYEYKYATGNVMPYHNYEERDISGTEGGLEYSGWIKECTACGAYETEKDYYNSNGDRVKHVREYRNDSALSGNVYERTVYEYVVINGCTYDKSATYERRDVYGHTYKNESRYEVYNDLSYIVYEYREQNTGSEKDGWEKYEYTYSFSPFCERTLKVTSSRGENNTYTESAHNGRYYVIQDSTCTQSGIGGYKCDVCGYIADSYEIEPIAHSWSYLAIKGCYVCTYCGLENANGASGEVVMEDLTSKYGNGVNYVVGYWARENIDFTYYVNILVDGEEIILDGVEVYEHGSVRALYFSRAAVEAAASRLGYEGYDVRITFVPYGADGSYDYALTFTDTLVNLYEIVGTASTTYDVPAGETVSIEFTPDDNGEWVIYSIGTADSYGSIYDSEGNLIGSNDDSGIENNFLLELYLEAGVTYRVDINWLRRDVSGEMHVEFVKC